jgi:hypothetical protein
MVRRHPERDARGLDLVLRPDQSLRHRRLGDEECPRDLVRRQPAERPQRQRDLGFGRKRGVTAGEQKLESLVGEGGVVHLVVNCLGQVE